MSASEREIGCTGGHFQQKKTARTVNDYFHHARVNNSSL
jgi:hypothetical protein